MTIANIVQEFTQKATPIFHEGKAGYFIDSHSITDFMSMLVKNGIDESSKAFNEGYKAGYDCSLLDNQSDFK